MDDHEWIKAALTQQTKTVHNIKIIRVFLVRPLLRLDSKLFYSNLQASAPLNAIVRETLPDDAVDRWKNEVKQFTIQQVAKASVELH